MQYEFRGTSIKEIVGKSVSSERRVERKIFSGHVLAPPLFWGPWITVFAQFGVQGPDADHHVTSIDVDLSLADSLTESTFDYEISGGDDFISDYGPNRERVFISGNVATEIRVRCKSHSVPVNVRIIAG